MCIPWEKTEWTWFKIRFVVWKIALHIYDTVYKCGINSWYNLHFLRMYTILNILYWYNSFLFGFIFVQNQYKFLYHALYESFRTGCHVLKKDVFVQEMDAQMQSDKATNLSNFRTEFKVNLLYYFVIFFPFDIPCISRPYFYFTNWFQTK